jgi:hypothetical protein
VNLYTIHRFLKGAVLRSQKNEGDIVKVKVKKLKVEKKDRARN